MGSLFSRRVILSAGISRLGQSAVLLSQLGQECATLGPLVRKRQKELARQKIEEEVGVVLPNDVLFVPRIQWGAGGFDGKLPALEQPVKYIRLTDTGGIPCDTFLTCSDRLRKMLKAHTLYHSLADIGYNFIVASDGKVYEGRGWHFSGEPLPEVKRVYKQCIQIAFIGSYGSKDIPVTAAVAVDKFLQYGVEANLIAPSYKLIGLKSPHIKAPYYEVKWALNDDGTVDLTNAHVLDDVKMDQ